MNDEKEKNEEQANQTTETKMPLEKSEEQANQTTETRKILEKNKKNSPSSITVVMQGANAQKVNIENLEPEQKPEEK